MKRRPGSHRTAVDGAPNVLPVLLHLRGLSRTVPVLKVEDRRDLTGVERVRRGWRSGVRKVGRSGSFPLLYPFRGGQASGNKWAAEGLPHTAGAGGAGEGGSSLSSRRSTRRRRRSHLPPPGPGWMEEVVALPQGRQHVGAPLRPAPPAQHQEPPEPLLEALSLDQAVGRPSLLCVRPRPPLSAASEGPGARRASEYLGPRVGRWAAGRTARRGQGPSPLSLPSSARFRPPPPRPPRAAPREV